MLRRFLLIALAVVIPMGMTIDANAGLFSKKRTPTLNEKAVEKVKPVKKAQKTKKAKKAKTAKAAKAAPSQKAKKRWLIF